MKSNAFGNPISRSEAILHENAWADLVRRGEADAEWFFRATNTLPMGDTNAVEFGQGAHVGMLRSVGGMTSGEMLEGGKPAPRGSVWQGVVVDDHAIVARFSRTAPDLTLSRARQLWTDAHRAYADRNLLPVPEVNCHIPAAEALERALGLNEDST